jgi:hypothetical protein
VKWLWGLEHVARTLAVIRKPLQSMTKIKQYFFNILGNYFFDPAYWLKLFAILIDVGKKKSKKQDSGCWPFAAG